MEKDAHDKQLGTGSTLNDSRTGVDNINESKVTMYSSCTDLKPMSRQATMKFINNDDKVDTNRDEIDSVDTIKSGTDIHSNYDSSIKGGCKIMKSAYIFCSQYK